MWEGCAVAGERVCWHLPHWDVLQTTTGLGNTELVHLTLASVALYPKTRNRERVELQPTGMTKVGARKIKVTNREGEKEGIAKGAACSYKHVTQRCSLMETNGFWLSF